MKNKIAFGLFEELKLYVQQQGKLFIEMGRVLKTFKDNELYKYLNYDSFPQFLADNEIGLSQSMAYAYITVFEIYILKFGYPKSEIMAIPFYKLQMIASSARDASREEADDLLEKAKALSKSDLRAELHETKANEGFEDHKPYPKAYRCKVCSNWIVDLPVEDFCPGHL